MAVISHTQHTKHRGCSGNNERSSFRMRGMRNTGVVTAVMKGHHLQTWHVKYRGYNDNITTAWNLPDQGFPLRAFFQDAQ